VGKNGDQVGEEGIRERRNERGEMGFGKEGEGAEQREGPNFSMFEPPHSKILVMPLF
jgi:hypothetical protein